VGDGGMPSISRRHHHRLAFVVAPLFPACDFATREPPTRTMGLLGVLSIVYAMHAAPSDVAGRDAHAARSKRNQT
jgi:hypothetical protein